METKIVTGKYLGAILTITYELIILPHLPHFPYFRPPYAEVIITSIQCDGCEFMGVLPDSMELEIHKQVRDEEDKKLNG